MEREPSVAVRRAVALLLTLGGDEALDAGGLGVKRLAELTGNEISRVSRTLDVLSESGLVDRDQDTRAYRLGWRLFGLAARAGQPRLRQAGATYVRRLTEEFGERAYLSVLEGGEVLTIVSESSSHTLQPTSWVGRSHPYLYATSAGRALMFSHTDEELVALLGKAEFVPPGPNGPKSFEEFAARLESERERGWALADEEFEPGLVGVAAPVFDFEGRVVAALNLSGPKFRSGAALAAAGPRLVEVAAELSSALGYAAGSHDAARMVG
jgi:IclR family transcriptional regulator, KDG regulon repressor